MGASVSGEIRPDTYSVACPLFIEKKQDQRVSWENLFGTTLDGID